jgi:hypothetical protein
MLSSGVLAAYGISLFGLSYPFFGNLGAHRQVMQALFVASDLKYL